MSKLLENAISLSRRIISSMGHWDQPAKLTVNSATYDIRCKYTNHNNRLNEFGAPVISSKAIIEVHAHELSDAGVPFMKSNGLVDMRGFYVEIQDAIAVRRYQISSTQPDETLGIIICNLELSNNNVRL